MRDHRYFVYMLASKPQGTLYTDVTNDLTRRVYEHREGLVPGFTSKYGVKMLVWYEEFGDIHDAIAQEKRIKRWQRDWKKNLIERDNPHWTDLYPGLLDAGSRALLRSPGMTRGDGV
ncbi:MAG TPA: GIY-YIG nuclease family protein [Rhizomicrobium sp.]|jgi:putative endonuclease|nr:GIY-YIG nuclease family protein [Rhizomicrobium sp.]